MPIQMQTLIQMRTQTPKPRIVFDANALISAMILPDSISGKAWRLGLMGFEVITSIAAMEEFDRKLSKPSLQRYFASEAERTEVMVAMNRSMLYVAVESVVHDSTADHDDDKFLELALDGNAVVIVSGDPDLKMLSPWRGIPILGTGDFVRAVEGGGFVHQK